MSGPAFTRIDDGIFSLEYDFERYNCFHFVCDFLSALRGERIRIEDFTEGLERRTGFTARFRRVEKPQTGTICMMRNPPHDIHVGAFYRGRLMHISRGGVAWVPLETVICLYNKVSLYDFR